MQNFKVLNRKFTYEEIDQFVFNGKLKYRGPKLYHYNSYIHGDSEEIHKAKHEAYNLGQKYMTKEIRDKI